MIIDEAFEVISGNKISDFDSFMSADNGRQIIKDYYMNQMLKLGKICLFPLYTAPIYIKY